MCIVKYLKLRNVRTIINKKKNVRTNSILVFEASRYAHEVRLTLGQKSVKIPYTSFTNCNFS